MSNSVQHRMSICRETQFGVTPTPATYSVVPIVSTTLGLSKGTIESVIADPRRQTIDVRNGNRQLGGEIASELVFGDFDKILEAVLMGTWAPTQTYTTATQAGAIAIAATNTISSGAAQKVKFTLPNGAISVTNPPGQAQVDVTIQSALITEYITVSSFANPDEDYSSLATDIATNLNNNGIFAAFYSASAIGNDVFIEDKEHHAQDNTLSVTVVTNIDAPGGALLAPWADIAAPTAVTAGVVGTLPIFNVGAAVQVFGFAGAPVDGVRFDVVSSSNGKLVLRGGALADTPGNTHVTITTLQATLVPGIVPRSHSILREFTDLVAVPDVTDPVQLYKGVMFNTLALTIQPEQIIKITLGMLGREYVNLQAAPINTTVNDWSGTEPFDGFVGSLSVDGENVANVTEITINLENGLEPRFVLFSDKTNTPKVGKCKVTGQITSYFSDSKMLEAFNSGTRHSLSFGVTDPDGNHYLFDIPTFRPTGGQSDTSEANDILVPVPYQAIYDKTNNVDCIKITRTPAPLPE